MLTLVQILFQQVLFTKIDNSSQKERQNGIQCLKYYDKMTVLIFLREKLEIIWIVIDGFNNYTKKRVFIPVNIQ